MIKIIARLKEFSEVIKMKKNNANKNEKNIKLLLSSLIADNRFLMIFSCIIAFSLWMWVAIEKSPEIQRVITGVPVQINLENSVPDQLGLKIFGKSEFTVDVTVTGKKYIISSMDKEDIDVIANTNYVDSSGKKTLQLKVSPKNNNYDYAISSVSQNYIEVFFDTYKEIELPLEGQIQTDLPSVVPDGCIIGDIVFSRNTVLISGPTTEVNQISSIFANISVDEVLEKTTTFDPVLKIVTNDGSNLEYTSIATEQNDITLTIPVLKEVTLPTAIEFRNAPSYFINNPLSYTVYPSKIKVALPVDVIEDTEYFVVSTIDFADISSSVNTFTIAADSVNSFKIMEDWVTNFTVKIDASKMVSKTIVIPTSKITIKNSRDDYSVALNNNRDIAVKLVGTENYINSISSDNLSIQVDTAEQEIFENTTVLQGRVVLSGDYPCWAVGRYDVKVKVVPIN